MSTIRTIDLLALTSRAAFACTEAGVVRDLNEPAAVLLGREADDLRGSELLGVDVGLGGGTLSELLARVAAGQPEKAESSWRDGSGREFAVCLQVLPASDGVVVLVEDRSVQERIAHELRENQARLQAILDHEPECVKLVDREARLLDMNPAGLTMIAAPSLEEVRNVSVLELLDPAYHELFLSGVEAVFCGEKTFQEFEVIALDGTRRWMEQHSAPLWDPDNPGQVKEMLAVTRDITDRKRSEAQILRKQRLESIGTLAGGLAHDLNNVLAPVMLSLEMLSLVAGDQEHLIEPLERSVERAAGMLRQLLAFAKGLGGERSEIEAGTLIDELEGILDATLPKDIQVELERSKVPLGVTCDPTQLHQVLLNLCLNARDAMRSGGTLTVSLGRETVTTACTTDLGEQREGDYVFFRVKDTGTGIPENVQARMFDPFFTTKGPDEGTGLGLASSLGIVLDHGGFLTLASQPGQGTTFTVFLPEVSVEQSQSSPPAELSDGAGSGRRVLVVEDEPLVRQVMITNLQKMGWETQGVSSGVEALAAFDEGGAFDLVISDLNMPGMRGTTLLRTLRERGVSCPFLLTSGRIEEKELIELKAIPLVQILNKPFRRQALLEALAKVLAPR